jgi:hypothetical protein
LGFCFSYCRPTGINGISLEIFLGFHYKFQKLTKEELAFAEYIFSSTKRPYYISKERKLEEVIRYFNVLVPYYTYESKFNFVGNIIEVSLENLICIKNEEELEWSFNEDVFIAKVLSVIYNKKVELEDKPIKDPGPFEGITISKEIRINEQGHIEEVE